METVENEVIDKSGWGDGPWQAEPDRVQWAHVGLDCLIVRNQRMGFWCGYVGVPATHPAFGKDYDDEILSDVNVHGGLTYADKCHGRICHVGGVHDEVWWLGFDAGHAWDASPGTRAMLPPELVDHSETYRDQAYVTAEVEQLAEQLAGFSEAKP